MPDITVLIHDRWLTRIPDLVARLREAGMTVASVEERIGVVTGSALQEALRSISGVEGVAAVEASRGFQLPPPESDLQ